MRHGGVTLFLTILTIAAVIIVNMIAAALAGRYDWMFFDMNPTYVYDISDNFQDYVSEYVIPEVDRVNGEKTAQDGNAEKIKIIFCDDEKNIMEDSSQKYIHDSFYKLLDIFPQYMEIDYLDIWERPSVARAYGVTATTDVVFAFNDRHETLNVADFYITESATSSTITAYNGEKMIASALLRVTMKDSAVCYFTSNHGENFGDYEFMRAVVEAGYSMAFIDLSAEDIPEDCELLVTFDPKQDFVVADSVSGVSEIEKLDNYMNNGGKYMVFMSADSFSSGARANIEGFLAKWGVKYMHETSSEGIEHSYLIKDEMNSTTPDGYTVLSKNATAGLGGTIMKGLPESNVFGNCTCISFADGFESNGNGDYIKTIDGKERIVSALMLAQSSAEAWSGGRAVARASETPFVLMSVSSQKCDNGEEAFLFASASTDFASAGSMNSAVLGNSRTVTGIFHYIGRENAPVELVFKPFGSTVIESLPTFDANVLTVVLVAVPAVTFAILGVFVLVRRKHL